MDKSPHRSPGRFVWYDLMTPDKAASINFYRNLFDWGSRITEIENSGSYSMFTAAGTDIGGCVPMDPSRTYPSHWMAYVTVDNVDEAAEMAGRLGGRTVVAPADIPGIGRFAVLTDPSGAAISPFSFHGDPPPELAGPPPFGHFCWRELLTDRIEDARTFYTRIFGWTTASMDMGEMGTYHLFKRGDVETAGLMTMPAEAKAPPFWLYYIHVPDVDTVSGRATELGATLHVAPRNIPEIGRFAVLADPLGASFALFGQPR